MPETIVPLAAGFDAADEAAWRKLVDKVLKGADFDRRLTTRTADGLTVQPLYTRATGAEAAAAARGAIRAEPTWDARQIHGAADPEATNAAILDDLAGGVTSIELQIAAPGSHGLDYHEPVLGKALAGVLLDVCPVHLHAGEYSTDAAGSLLALWRSRGLSDAQCRGGFGYDPLGTLAATGALYHPLDRALGIAAELVRTTLLLPHVSALKADGAVWHAGGASEAQELAAVFASVVAYLRAAERAGLLPRQVWPKIAITVAVDADQFLNIAKLRALRLGLARIAGACGVSVDVPVEVRAVTSARMMTRRDPWVNLLRTTIACASAAMGAADAITVLPLSHALGAPDAFARRIARNTHAVLMEESGLGRVQDPAGGSFYVERLTAELAAVAWAAFQAIEGEGGLGLSLQTGALQTRIAATVAERQAALAKGRIDFTGTSAFPKLGDDGMTVAPWPLPLAVDLPGERVTPLSMQRQAVPFELLRDEADAAAAAGKPMRVFLATLGPLASHGPRAQWMRNLLAAGGIEAIGDAPLLTSTDAGRAFAESGCAVACLAAADELYAELGEATVALLKTAGARDVFVAGRQSDALTAALNGAGAAGYVYAGMDRVTWLADLQRRLGRA
jgi:methylmalonyl-CoA mutase